MKTYQHTQRGIVILVAMSVSVAAMLLGGLAFRPVLVGIPILALCGWLFHSLTIEIAEAELRWRFGPGWIHKQVPLAEIASAKAVRTNVIEGWGIHLSRYGWLYNVSGFDAVAITLKNGKRFCLGTDEPETLANQLAQQLATVRADWTRHEGGVEPPQPGLWSPDRHRSLELPGRREVFVE